MPQNDKNERTPGQTNYCPNCEGNFAWADHCSECGWMRSAPPQQRLEDKWMHEAQCRLLRATVQSGLGYASDDSARYAGRCIKQLREQVAGLETALKSQIEITNTERASKELAEAKLRAPSAERPTEDGPRQIAMQCAIIAGVHINPNGPHTIEYATACADVQDAIKAYVDKLPATFASSDLPPVGDTSRTDARAFWGMSEGPLPAKFIVKPEHATDIRQFDHELLGPCVEWKVVTVDVARQLEIERNSYALAAQKAVERNIPLSAFQRKIEEAEARCCPEDVGFEEWIGVLKRQVGERDVQIATLTAAVNAMNQSPESATLPTKGAPAMDANCFVCGKHVAAKDQAAHLRLQHPTPTGGFRFWFDGKAYRTDKPSVLVMDILKMVDYPPTYQFFEERKTGDVPLSHMNSVDLTREPHFYCVPPATW